jgi:hypothetical protein
MLRLNAFLVKGDNFLQVLGLLSLVTYQSCRDLWLMAT